MERPRGTIKSAPEDFVVDEIPAYEPSGDGPHLFVHFRKTNLTTDDAVRAISTATGVDRREVGVAGLKDKVAVTTQWISLPASAEVEDRIDRLDLEGISLLARKRHGNKLKTGHLRGNAFRIVVRGLDAAAAESASAVLDRIAREGVPNAFGAQRFGRDGDNHERARAWLTGAARAPADPRLRRFHFSAFQSWIFNLVLDERIRLGSWNTPLVGDLLRKEESGGMFVCTDVQRDRERADQGEVCPTGPIVGDKMREPEAEALELEQRIVVPCIEGVDLRRARSLGEGTRRALALRLTRVSHRVLRRGNDALPKHGPNDGPNNGTHDEAMTSSSPMQQRDEQPVHADEGAAIEVQFVLPRGAYATTVLSNVFSVVDAARPSHPAMTEEE